ncbi:MAG: methyltransferase, partial [bacterium]|nr:methyltransferase [bacterium]
MQDSRSQCLLCGSSRLADMFRVNNVPVLCNQLWPDFASARTAPRGDLDVVICMDCALIFNRAFDASRLDYGPGYENALHYSTVFQAFAKELAAKLTKIHDLAEKHIVEIGCGDGHMLDLMVQNGVKSAVGFDPSVPESKRGNVT